MKPIIDLIIFLLNIYTYILIAMVIYSWGSVLGFINTRNPTVMRIGDVLYGLTEPVLRPLRRFIPSVNGLDLSVLAAFIVIDFLLIPYLRDYVRPIVP